MRREGEETSAPTQAQVQRQVSSIENATGRDDSQRGNEITEWKLKKSPNKTT